MRIEVDTDVNAFAEAAVPWLMTEPLLNNVPVTVIRSRAEGITPVEPNAVFVRILDDGDALTGVALHTPPHPLLLPALGEKAVLALADGLVGVRPGLPGVGGPREAAARFASRWSVHTGTPARLKRDSLVHVLGTLAPPQGVPGRMREARPEDRELIADWTSAFHAEAMGEPVTPEERRKRLVRTDGLIAHGGMVWLWDVDGTPVSLAGTSLVTDGIVRVQLVYTPEEHRGHGYASANVAELSARKLALPEVTTCMLYTDAANDTANRVYARIGYRVSGDAAEYRFGND